MDSSEQGEGAGMRRGSRSRGQWSWPRGRRHCSEQGGVVIGAQRLGRANTGLAKNPFSFRTVALVVLSCL